MALFLGTDVINKKSLQDNLASCFYNHNELDLRNSFFREEEVFVWVKTVTHRGRVIERFWGSDPRKKRVSWQV
jgi:hypothetical protein